MGTLAILLLGLLASCVDEIKLNIPEGEQAQLVVMGALTQGSPPQVEVTISRTGGIEPDAIPAPIAGASVRLEDRAGNFLVLTDQGKGRYADDLPPGKGPPIVTGGEYRLQVTLPEGRRYESDWSLLLPAPAADSLSFDLVSREEVNDIGNIITTRYIRFFVHTPLEVQGRRPALKWDFSGCYQLREAVVQAPQIQKLCYVSENVNLAGVAVYNPQETAADRLNRYLLFEEKLNYRFGEAYYLTVYQQSIPQDALTYWEQIREVLARSRGVFDPPPGSVRTNWHGVDNPSERVEGFFFARTVDTIRRKIILPDGTLPPRYCDPPAGRTGVCADCLLFPGSSLEKPDYWID